MAIEAECATQVSEFARQPAKVEPLTEDESLQFDDMQWATQDETVRSKYMGEFVVPFHRQIVAHGKHLKTVLAEASRVTRKKVEELPVVSIDSLLNDVRPY